MRAFDECFECAGNVLKVARVDKGKRGLRLLLLEVRIERPPLGSKYDLALGARRHVAKPMELT